MLKVPEVFLETNSLSPERNLVAAMLIRAIADICAASECDRCSRANAYAWFRSESEEAFSFLWACEILNLPPEHVKAFMRRCQKEGFENLMPDWVKGNPHLNYGQLIH